jgi:hypothetical protein
MSSEQLLGIKLQATDYRVKQSVQCKQYKCPWTQDYCFLPSSSSTSTTLEAVVTPPSYQRHEPTIEHKYSLLESLASTRLRYLLAMESMQDHKQHGDDKSINQLDKVLNIHRIPINTTCKITQWLLIMICSSQDLNMKHMEEKTSI